MMVQRIEIKDGKKVHIFYSETYHHDGSPCAFDNPEHALRLLDVEARAFTSAGWTAHEE